MKTDQIKAKIEKLQAEAQAVEQLNADLPADLPQPDSLCWQNSSLCEFSYSHKVKTVSEVKAIVNQWTRYILPLNLSKGTFTTFRTPEHKPERGEKTSEPVYPITVKVDHFGLGFDFYAKVGNHLLSVSIDFDYGANFHQLASVRFDVVETTSRQGRKTQHIDKTTTILSAPGFNVDKKIKWAQGSGDYPNDFTLYWREGFISLFDEIFA